MSKRKRIKNQIKRERIFQEKFKIPKDTGEYKGLSLPSWAITTSHIPSQVSGKGSFGKKPNQSYTDDMLEREIAAQEEIERKKKRVGILYNKGVYGYLGENPEDDIIKSLGKK